jgi:hypothetical protein
VTKEMGIYNQDPKALESEEEMLTAIGWSTKNDKVAVLVEGNLDYLFFTCIIRSDDEGPCFIYPVKDSSNTKGKIIKALKDVHSGALKGPGRAMIGIVDSDFMGIEKARPRVQNLFFTHTHDIETTLMSAGSLERWLQELIQSHVIDYTKMNFRIKGPWVEGYVQIVVQQAFDLGLIRYYLEKKGLYDLKRSINVSEHLDMDRFLIQMDELITKICGQMRCDEGVDIEMAKDDVYLDIERMKDLHLPEWNIINGHDVEEIIEISMAPIILGRIRISRRSIEHALLANLSYNDVLSFPIYRYLVDWQSSNRIMMMVDNQSEFLNRMKMALSDI